jgi:hypothetical protein
MTEKTVSAERAKFGETMPLTDRNVFTQRDGETIHH